MILTTNEQAFNTIFKGRDMEVYWRVFRITDGYFIYKYCNSAGEVAPHEDEKPWGVSLTVASECAWKSLDPNYKDEGAVINKIRMMAKRFENRRQAAA